MTECKHVSFSEEEGIHGFWGIITLNRPEAYNALNHDMIVHIQTQLAQWSQNLRLLGVFLHSLFDKAFCAGGDIRTLYEQGKKGDTEALKIFFRDEYRLIHTIHHYPKPWVSCVHGITMGGGVGISIHGRHRVATETLRFAMPECAIGFFPDVGGSYFLSRMPGELGVYLGLSGVTISAGDALYGGLVDHCIAAGTTDALKAQLLQIDFYKVSDPNEAIAAVLKQQSIMYAPSQLLEHRELIDAYFRGHSVENIVRRLQENNSPWCQTLAHTLLQKSPLSLKVTLEQLRRGRKLNLDTCLEMEYGLAQHFARDCDFYEGVRAQIVDKDKQPKWQPETLEAVHSDKVAAYFNTLYIDKLYS